MTTRAVGDKVFILMVAPAVKIKMAEDRRPLTLMGRVVGEATVDRVDEDGTLWVSPTSGHGHKTPWRKSPDECWTHREAAERELRRQTVRP